MDMTDVDEVKELTKPGNVVDEAMHEDVGIAHCARCHGTGILGVVGEEEDVFGSGQPERVCDHCKGWAYMKDGLPFDDDAMDELASAVEDGFVVGGGAGLHQAREWFEKGLVTRPVPDFEDLEEVPVMHGTAADFDGEDIAAADDLDGGPTFSYTEDAADIWVTEDRPVGESFAFTGAEMRLEEDPEGEVDPKLHHYDADVSALETANLSEPKWWQIEGGYGVKRDALEFLATEHLDMADAPDKSIWADAWEEKKDGGLTEEEMLAEMKSQYEEGLYEEDLSIFKEDESGGYDFPDSAYDDDDPY